MFLTSTSGVLVLLLKSGFKHVGGVFLVLSRLQGLWAGAIYLFILTQQPFRASVFYLPFFVGSKRGMAAKINVSFQVQRCSEVSLHSELKGCLAASLLPCSRALVKSVKSKGP
jgi:hypothetical protein